MHGVDRSSSMLNTANERCANLPPALRERLTFTQGDLRHIRLEQQFDVVTALFHVISYQTKNEALQAAFETARAHLRPAGTFIFDCWYGPAVLCQRPEVRVARFEDEAVEVTRIAEPRLLLNENRVDAHYQLLARAKTGHSLDVQEKVHELRYLFKPEIEKLLGDAGMRLSTWGNG